MQRFGVLFVVSVLMAGALISDSAARNSLFAGSASATTIQCSQSDMVVPVGQAQPSTAGDPMIPAYCINAAPQSATRVTGANDWVDRFGVNGTARFNDHDMG